MSLDIAEQVKRIADSFDRIANVLEKTLAQPTLPPEPEPEPMETPWKIVLWSIDRGVVVSTFQSEESSKVGDRHVIGGLEFEVVEVSINPESMRCRCKVAIAPVEAPPAPVEE
jgi:hypothetical protein